jgi:hypothetical protein
VARDSLDLNNEGHSPESHELLRAHRAGGSLSGPMGTKAAQPFPQDPGFAGATLRDVALVIALSLDPVLPVGHAGMLERVAGRLPRPVLIAAAIAATAGIAAVIHFTDGAVGAGLAGGLPQVFPYASPPQR